MTDMLVPLDRIPEPIPAGATWVDPLDRQKVTSDPLVWPRCRLSSCRLDLSCPPADDNGNPLRMDAYPVAARWLLRRGHQNGCQQAIDLGCLLTSGGAVPMRKVVELANGSWAKWCGLDEEPDWWIDIGDGLGPTIGRKVLASALRAGLGVSDD